MGIHGHGIQNSQIEAARTVTRALFALPAATRLKYSVEGGAGQRGYTPFAREKARDQSIADLKEFWHVGREILPPPEDPGTAPLPKSHEPGVFDRAYPPNLWPEEVPGFREVTLLLYQSLEDLGKRLLRLVAVDLGLSEDYFDSKVDRGNSILRLIHYPPLPEHPTGVRASQHEDINLLTLLVGSEQEGLQIHTRADRWIPVTTIEGTIVCNVGDMLQRLTNNTLRSTTHRVVNPPPPKDQEPRFSMPFFLHFNADVVIRTLPTCIGPGHEDRYPTPITAHDFLEQRLREIGLLT